MPVFVSLIDQIIWSLQHRKYVERKALIFRVLRVSVWSNSHESEKFTEVVLFSGVSWSSVLFFFLTGKSKVSSVEKIKKEIAVSVKL